MQEQVMRYSPHPHIHAHTHATTVRMHLLSVLSLQSVPSGPTGQVCDQGRSWVTSVTLRGQKRRCIELILFGSGVGFRAVKVQVRLPPWGSPVRRWEGHCVGESEFPPPEIITTLNCPWIFMNSPWIFLKYSCCSSVLKLYVSRPPTAHNNF